MALMVGTFYLVFRNFMYGNVNFYERYELNKEVAFAQKNLQREAFHLHETVSEWAEKGEIPRGSVFKQGSYIVVVVNDSNEVTYSTKYDEQAKKSTSIPKELITLIASKKIPSDKNGILTADNKIFIASTQKIKTPSNGTILVAREMDPLILDSRHADKLSFKFEILNNKTSMIAQHAVTVTKDNKITEVVTITDIFGQPALMLEVGLERYMMSHAQYTLWSLIIALVIVSVLFSAALLYMVKKLTSLEKQFVEAGKLASLGALGASISHELNNPLTIVHGYTDNLSEILEEEGIRNKKVSSALEKIKVQTERMMITIKHIKEFTKYAEGEASNPVNMNLLIQKSVDEFKQQFNTHQIQLKLKQDKQLPPIFVNPTKMASVVQNLLTNARDAVDEKTSGNDKKIEVSANVESKDQDRFIVLKVKDNGIGIPKKNISKIFDPYFTTKDVAKGVGLGLSLVQGVVREYNGKIEVESTNGETSFTIKFPINPLLSEHRSI